MIALSSAALLLLGLASALPSAELSDPQFSPNTLHLDRVPRSLNSPSLRKRASTTQLFSTDGNNQFTTNIKFGNQQFKVVVDTGSSDTWLVGAGFQCVDPNGNQVALSECGFAGVYKYGKDTTLSQDANEQDENFLVSYGSGEALTGYLANDQVTLAGITFETEIGVAKTGYWNGDGKSSGLLGLAFPALTSAFIGTDPSQDSSQTRTAYDPILYQLFEDNNYTPALFSIAMSRDLSRTGYGGSLTIGGVPNLSDPRINAKPKWTYTDIIDTLLISDQELSFYTIMVDSTSWGSGSKKSSDNTARRYAVDSGTSLMYMPSHVAKGYNSLWNKQATHHPKEGIWTVPCDATAPPFTITIAGTAFSINAKDLLQPGNGQDCLSSIVDVLGNPPLLLGDVFLKNVVAVFDWGNERMGFTAREFYQS